METGTGAVKKFMACIAAGFIVYVPAVCLIYFLIHRFTLAVLLGALYGSAVTLIYYYLFARAIKNAAELDPEDVKKRIQAAYSLRMFLLVVLMGAGFILDITLGVLEWLPMLLALLVPRIPILIYQKLESKRAKDNND